MQYLAICEDDLLFQFMRNVLANRVRSSILCTMKSVARRIRREGGKVRHGDLLKEETYKEVKLQHIDQAIVFVRDAGDQDRICHLLARSRQEYLHRVAHRGKKRQKRSQTTPIRWCDQLQLADIFDQFCASQLLDTLNVKKVERIRSLFDDGTKSIFSCNMIPTRTLSAARWRCASSSGAIVLPHRSLLLAKLLGRRTWP